MLMKSFIYTITSLSFLEFIILVIVFYFYIKQFTFGAYMHEVYKRNEYLSSKNNTSFHDYKSKKFEELFGSYHDFEPVAYLILIFSLIVFLIIIFISNFIFIIVYLCHLCRRTCCKCKKTCSYISLIVSIFFSMTYLSKAIGAKSKIDLPDEEIYSYDPDFNKITRKNINFMKLRKIILITGVFLVYISYIVRFVLLCKFNKKLIILDDNATHVTLYQETENNNKNNTKKEIKPNQIEILSTDDN